MSPLSLGLCLSFFILVLQYQIAPTDSALIVGEGIQQPAVLLSRSTRSIQNHLNVSTGFNRFNFGSRRRASSIGRKMIKKKSKRLYKLYLPFRIFERAAATVGESELLMEFRGDVYKMQNITRATLNVTLLLPNGEIEGNWTLLAGYSSSISDNTSTIITLPLEEYQGPRNSFDVLNFLRNVTTKYLHQNGEEELEHFVKIVFVIKHPCILDFAGICNQVFDLSMSFLKMDYTLEIDKSENADILELLMARRNFIL